MNKIISIATTLLFAGIVNAQVINQWNFADTAGTSHTAAVDSVGSTTFSTQVNGAGNWTTNGSGLLTGGGGTIGNADIADVSTGVYQMDLTGVTFTSLSGGTDDWGVFGLRSGASSSTFLSTISSFDNLSPSFDQAVLVFGNENNSSGLDLRVIDNGTATLVNDVTANFTGTFDFRILIDLTNDTADYLWQVNGGGYNTIVSQQLNAVASINILALGGSTFSDTISIDQASWAAIPEPSTFMLVGLALGALAIFRRRK